MHTLLLLAALLAPHPQEPDAPNPTLVEAAAPTYPRSHFSNPNRTVLVGLTVSTSGTPENVHIVRTGGDRFDRNAIETVSQYKFRPARKSGQPIAQDIQVEVNYKSR